LKERYATLEPIDEPDHELQMGDACTVNMDGYMADENGNKGEPLPNAASGDSVEVVLGEGRYMEGLVEGLVGAKVGETRTVSVSFPDVSAMGLCLLNEIYRVLTSSSGFSLLLNNACCISVFRFYFAETPR